MYGYKGCTMSSLWKHFFLFWGGTLNSVQGLLLAQQSRMTPDKVWGSYRVLAIEWVDHLQRKHSAHCTISMDPVLSFLGLHFVQNYIVSPLNSDTHLLVGEDFTLLQLLNNF